MIPNMISGRRKALVAGAVAIAALSLCAAKPAEAYGWRGGGWGWHGGWGWAGPRVGIGFGYYPGPYAYAPGYYAPPVTYYAAPPYYYAPASYAVTRSVTHRTVHHVHKAAATQICPVPQAQAPQAQAPQAGSAGTPSQSPRTDY